MCNDALGFLLVLGITSVDAERFCIIPRSLPHAAISQVTLQETKALPPFPPGGDRILGVLPPPGLHSDPLPGDIHFTPSRVLLPSPEHDRLKPALSVNTPLGAHC